MEKLGQAEMDHAQRQVKFVLLGGNKNGAKEPHFSFVGYVSFKYLRLGKFRRNNYI